MRYDRRGVRSFFRGVRTGDPKLIALGAALLAFRYLRRERPARLVYQQRLRPGDVVKIGFDPQDR
jgi:hypothetical protein